MVLIIIFRIVAYFLLGIVVITLMVLISQLITVIPYVILPIFSILAMKYMDIDVTFSNRYRIRSFKKHTFQTVMIFCFFCFAFPFTIMFVLWHWTLSIIAKINLFFKSSDQE